MAILPSEILTEEEIKKFIGGVNSNAKKIVGDSKFVIPDPSLPGVGMLIKLWIRQSEKTFSTYLAPIILIKDVLSKPLELVDKIKEIKTFVDNPINFILEETINPDIQNNFFLPIKLSVGEFTPTADFSNLSSLIARSESEVSIVLEDTRPKFPYVSGGISSVPKDGEYTINDVPAKSTQLYLSIKDYNGNSIYSYLSVLIPGDTISLEYEGASQSWIVKNIIQNNGYYTFEVTPQDETISQEVFAVTEKTIYLQVQQNSKTAGSKALSSLFTDASGNIKFPIVLTVPNLLSIVGINVNSDLLSKIKVRIGSFNDLVDGNPIKIKVKELENKSGWNFEKDVLSKILKGKYPKIDYPKDPNAPKTEKQKAREELLALAKVFEMLVKTPAAFFKILASYLKLLLLPIQIVVGTIKTIFQTVLKKPLSIFSLIAKFSTDPIGALGDLIAEAVLSTIRPYLEPTLTAAGISWDDATNEKINGTRTGKGLQPLVSDLLIGRFKCKEIKGTGNGTITQTSPAPGATGAEPSIQFTNYSYVVKYDGTPPQEGEVSLNNLDLNKVNVIKISSLDANVNSTLTNLVELLPGSEISIPKDGGTWVYTVNQRISPTGNLSYFDYRVSLVYGPGQDSPTGIAGQIQSASSPVNGRNRAVLSPGADLANFKFTSPDPFLQCLIVNYLPIKIIAIWESVKGILGVILGFVATIPFLIKAVFKSIFSKSIGDQSINILQVLSDPNSGARINSRNPTNKESETNLILEALTAPGGIDVILQGLAKNDPRFLVIKRKPGKWSSSLESNTDFEQISMTEFSKRIKILLTIAKYYRLNNNKFTGGSVEISYLDSNDQAVKIQTAGEDVTNFTNVLGADSLGTVEFIPEFEKEFDMSIPEDQAEKITITIDSSTLNSFRLSKYKRKDFNDDLLNRGEQIKDISSRIISSVTGLTIDVYQFLEAVDSIPNIASLIRINQILRLNLNKFNPLTIGSILSDIQGEVKYEDSRNYERRVLVAIDKLVENELDVSSLRKSYNGYGYSVSFNYLYAYKQPPIEPPLDYIRNNMDIAKALLEYQTK